MLFLLGDDIENVALKTGYPKDVILITAAHYRWREKRDMLVEQGKEGELIKDVEKAMLNQLLMATYKAVTNEVGQILAGKMGADQSRFIPGSMQGLQRLLEMIEKANKLVAVGDQEKPPPGSTIVHAENVQINNLPADANFETKRQKFLQAMAAKADKKG